MKIAVKLYRDVSNPEGIPENWPAESYMFDEKIHKPTDDYIVMTEDEYKKYKELHYVEYDEWQRNCQYKNSFLEDRKKEYPSDHDILFAIIDVIKALYPVPEDMPLSMKKIISKINSVNDKYPNP